MSSLNFFFFDTACSWAPGDFCLCVWDPRDGKLMEAKIWDIKECPQKRPYAVVVFEELGEAEYSVWLSDLKPSPRRISSFEGTVNIILHIHL